MPPNAVAPRVKVDFLDKPRYLLYDFAALELYEQVTGKSYSSVFTDLSVSNMAHFLWAGLLHESPKMTIAQVKGMLHLGNLAEVQKAILEAAQIAMPFPENGTATAATPTPAAAAAAEAEGSAPGNAREAELIPTG